MVLPEMVNKDEYKTGACVILALHNL